MDARPRFCLIIRAAGKAVKGKWVQHFSNSPQVPPHGILRARAAGGSKRPTFISRSAKSTLAGIFSPRGCFAVCPCLTAPVRLSLGTGNVRILPEGSPPTGCMLPWHGAKLTKKYTFLSVRYCKIIAGRTVRCKDKTHKKAHFSGSKIMEMSPDKKVYFFVRVRCVRGIEAVVPGEHSN